MTKQENILRRCGYRKVIGLSPNKDKTTLFFKTMGFSVVVAKIDENQQVTLTQFANGNDNTNKNKFYVWDFKTQNVDSVIDLCTLESSVCRLNLPENDITELLPDL